MDNTELRSIHWDGNAIVLLDQTCLPAAIRYVKVRDTSGLVDAIKRKVVRGAPALASRPCYRRSAPSSIDRGSSSPVYRPFSGRINHLRIDRYGAAGGTRLSCGTHSGH